MTTNIFVQFADSSDSGIISVFAGPQNQTAYPNQATIPSTDARYETWYAAIPELIKGLGGFVAPGA